MRRTLQRAVVGAVAMLTAACGTAPAPVAVTSADAAVRAADLAMYREKIFAREKAYTPEARAAAEKRLVALEANPAAGSDAAYVLELSRIVALADNGHSVMSSTVRSQRFNRVDVRLAPFGEDFYVLRASAAQAALLGGRLVAIDGHAIKDLRDAARTLVGGTPAYRDRYAPYLLESPQQLEAIGLAKHTGQARYSFVMLDGRKVDVDLVAAAPDAAIPAVRTSRILDPTLDANEATWRSLLPLAKAPWSLTGAAGSPFRWRDAPEIDAVVIELRQINSTADASIMTFLKTADAEREKLGRRNVVLDLRFNPGGNLVITRDFFANLPARLGPDGRIAVLMSPWTFSAAISSIGYLKQAGGERVLLIGEAPGDRLEFWAEGAPVVLPSGVRVGLATERHDYRNGCKGYSDCHGNVVRRPIAIASLEPDIAAPWTIEAYVAGRDPAMEAVQAAFGKTN